MSATTGRYALKPDPHSSHSILLRWLGEGRARRVLDVGAADGILNRTLSARGWRVTGVEGDPAVAAAGAAHCERMITANLNGEIPPVGGPFDAIVYGDVLEHLIDPRRVLVELDRALAPDGVVVVSVPNVAHLYIRLGRFDDADRGILDDSHRRFFTARSLRALIAGAGLVIERFTATPVPLYQILPARWHGRWVAAVHAVSAASARTLPRLLGYQFVVLARPKAVAFRAGKGSRMLEGAGKDAQTAPAGGQAELPDIGVESPLIERAPGVAVPGVVSLDRLRPCNDAAIEAGPPLVAALPYRRWAYGLLFPLDHAALGANRDRPVVVSLDLVVEAGHVGILGVAEGFDRPTTMETVVGPGRTTACLTLDPPTRTSAIVLRNVAEGGARPCVTVTAIGAYEPGPPRLARRTPDLGFDLFVVLAPAKTATQTVEQTLLALAPGIQVRRAHGLSETAIMPPAPAHVGPDHPWMQSRKKQIDYGRVLKWEIAAVRALGGRIAFVTAIREPVDHAVSDLFQGLQDAIPAFAELHAIGPDFVALLAAGLIAHWRRECRAPAGHAAPDSWFWKSLLRARSYFGDEFRGVTGVDLLDHPIDRAAGFTLLRQDHQAVLLFRYEDLARGLAPGLAALIGRPHIVLRDTNRADAKPYAALYREFRARFRIPADLVAEIYDRDPYLRHFYTDEEIAAFKAKWTAPQPREARPLQ